MVVIRLTIPEISGGIQVSRGVFFGWHSFSASKTIRTWSLIWYEMGRSGLKIRGSHRVYQVLFRLVQDRMARRERGMRASHRLLNSLLWMGSHQVCRLARMSRIDDLTTLSKEGVPPRARSPRCPARRREKPCLHIPGLAAKFPS